LRRFHRCSTMVIACPDVALQNTQKPTEMNRAGLANAPQAKCTFGAALVKAQKSRAERQRGF
jgi:hypothetical protein